MKAHTSKIIEAVKARLVEWDIAFVESKSEDAHTIMVKTLINSALFDRTIFLASSKSEGFGWLIHDTNNAGESNIESTTRKKESECNAEEVFNFVINAWNA